MTESVSTAQESAVTTEGSTADQTEAFVSAVTDALEQSGADQTTIELVSTHGSAMVEHVEQLESENEQLSERVEQLESESEQLSERVEQLESESEQLSELLDSTRREQAGIRSDVHEVRETVESHDDGEIEPAERDETPTPDASSSPMQTPETSLGQAIRLPEHVAEENLTKNQQRARSVAKDIHEYATSVPAGYRLGASEMRRVLSAQEDGATIHGQTLARCRDFLVRLGGDHVELKESRNGTTSVIFDEDFVRRVVAWANENGGHDVVSRGGVSG